MGKLEKERNCALTLDMHDFGLDKINKKKSLSTYLPNKNQCIFHTDTFIRHSTVSLCTRLATPIMDKALPPLNCIYHSNMQNNSLVTNLQKTLCLYMTDFAT